MDPNNHISMISDHDSHANISQDPVAQSGFTQQINHDESLIPGQLRSWHNFVHNPEDIKLFASIFQVEQRHLALCLYLTMRRKYYPSLSHGITIVNRIAVTGGPDFVKKLYQSVLKLETPVGKRS